MVRLRRLLDDRGFTLIELLVVILTIAVLIAVAAPSFLGQAAKAQDSVAKQDLSNAYRAAKALSIEATDQGSYAEVSAVALAELEPALAFHDGLSDPATSHSINISHTEDGDLVLKARSESGKVCILTAPKNGAQAIECFDSVTSLRLSNVIQLTSGFSHTCALIADGTIQCWGDNSAGQLGNGDSNPMGEPTPVAVQGISNAVQISAGLQQTCALLSDHTIQCWGYGGWGNLGDGHQGGYYTSFAPVQVVGITNATQVEVGYSGACALLSDSSVKCWGHNDHGQLGLGFSTGSPNYSIGTPTQVQGLTGVTQISFGDEHGCALLTNKTIKCWGYNYIGQLGDGTSTNRTSPVAVLNVSDAIQISTSYLSSCALLSDHTAKCWGPNFSGLLGDGLLDHGHHYMGIYDYSPDAVTVVGLAGINKMDASDDGTCGRVARTIFCWGLNDWGQIGDGTTTDSASPVPVAGVNNAIQVVTGYNHTCILVSGGYVECVGNNDYAQLGNGLNLDDVWGMYFLTPKYVVPGA